MSTKKIEDYLNTYGGYKSQVIGPDLGLLLKRSSFGVGQYPPRNEGVFGCCGARSLTGMNGDYLTTELHRQEFALMLNTYTFYFLPTTYQMKMFKDKKTSVLHMLFELGAKQVFESPNRLHGPNNLHLCVLDTKAPETLEAKKKLSYTHKFKGPYGYDMAAIIPMEIAKLCGLVGGTPEEQPPAESVPPTFRKQRLAPHRDALGRFTRRVG